MTAERPNKRTDKTSPALGTQMAPRMPLSLEQQQQLTRTIQPGKISSVLGRSVEEFRHASAAPNNSAGTASPQNEGCNERGPIYAAGDKHSQPTLPPDKIAAALAANSVSSAGRRSTWNLNIRRRSVAGRLTGFSADDTSACSESDLPDSITGLRSSEQDENKPEYEVKCELGAGGMGVVYEARQTSLNRSVAIKTMKGDAENPEFDAVHAMAAFVSEAVVTAHLVHPNIVPVHDLSQTKNGKLFYAMKQVGGTAWDRRIHDNHLNANLDILLKVCDAMAYAHTRGVVNRDLKPENVMVGDFGEVLVLDWGLAVTTSQFVAANSVQVDQRGGTGTPGYMAPELTDADIRRIAPTTDIYLLGAILFEILEGYPPHLLKSLWNSNPNMQLIQIYQAALNNEIETDVEQTGELMQIARKAMQTRQEDRYQTVEEFQEAIREYLVTGRAEEIMQQIEHKGSASYSEYQTAVGLYHEALRNWPNNPRAKKGDHAARHGYAQLALKKGDLDLGLEVLNSSPTDAAPDARLASKLKRSHRNRSVIKFTWFAAMVAAVGFAVFAGGEKRKADNARTQTQTALDELNEAVDNLNEAKDEVQQQTQLAAAETQRAEDAAEQAQKQTELATLETKRAEDAAEQARKQTQLAAAETQRAEEAAEQAQKQTELATAETKRAEEAAEQAQKQTELATAETKRAEKEKMAVVIAKQAAAQTKFESLIEQLEAMVELGRNDAINEDETQAKIEEFLNKANAAVTPEDRKRLTLLADYTRGSRTQATDNQKLDYDLGAKSNSQVDAAQISADGSTRFLRVNKELYVVRSERSGADAVSTGPLHGPDAPIKDMAVSADGSVLCAVQSKTVFLWRWNAAKNSYTTVELGQSGLIPFKIQRCVLSDNHLYLFGQKKTVAGQVRTIADPQQTNDFVLGSSFLDPDDMKWKGLVVLPDDSGLIVSEDDISFIALRDSSASLPEPINSGEPPRLPSADLPAGFKPQRLVVSPNGQRLVLVKGKKIVFADKTAKDKSSSVPSPDDFPFQVVGNVDVKAPGRGNIQSVAFDNKAANYAVVAVSRYLQVWIRTTVGDGQSKWVVRRNPDWYGSSDLNEKRADQIKKVEEQKLRLFTEVPDFAPSTRKFDVWLEAAKELPSRPSRDGWLLAAHAKSLVAVAFEGNGHTLISSVAKDGCRVWNTDTYAAYRREGLEILQDSRPPSTTQAPPSLQPRVQSAASARRARNRRASRYLLTAGRVNKQRSPLAITQGNSTTLGTRVFSARFSTDGERFVVGTNALRAYAFDSQGEQVLAMAMTPVHDSFDKNHNNFREGHLPELVSLQFLPDGQRLMTFDYFGQVSVWDAAQDEDGAGYETCRLLPEQASCEVTVSPDGQWVAAATLQETSEGERPAYGVRMWKNEALLNEVAPAGQVLAGTTRQPVTAAAFSPDSKWLMAGTRRGTIVLWDVETRTQLAQLSGQHGNDAVSGIFFSGPEQLVTVGFDGVALRHTIVRDGEQYRISDSKPIERADGQSRPDFIIRLRPRPDGRGFVTADLRNRADLNQYELTLRFYDLDSGTWTNLPSATTIISTPEDRGKPYRHDVAWSEDGSQLLYTHGDRLLLIDPASWQVRQGFQLPQQAVRGVFSPDGRRIATFDGRFARMWDVNPDSPEYLKDVAQFRSHGPEVVADFSPGRRFLATASESLRVFRADEGDELTHGKPEFRLSRQQVGSRPLADVRFQPRIDGDGNYTLATIDVRGNIKLWAWNPASSQPPQKPFVFTGEWQVEDHSGERDPGPLANQLVWSRDGGLLGAVRNSQLQLYRPSADSLQAVNLPLPQVLSGIDFVTNTAAFSADGSILAAGGKRWDENEEEWLSFAYLWRIAENATTFVGVIDAQDQHQIDDDAENRDLTGITAMLVDTSTAGEEIVKTGGSDGSVQEWLLDPEQAVENVTALRHDRIVDLIEDFGLETGTFREDQKHEQAITALELSAPNLAEERKWVSADAGGNVLLWSE